MNITSIHYKQIRTNVRCWGEASIAETNEYTPSLHQALNRHHIDDAGYNNHDLSNTASSMIVISHWHKLNYMNRDISFPTMWYFGKCRLR